MSILGHALLSRLFPVAETLAAHPVASEAVSRHVSTCAKCSSSHGLPKDASSQTIEHKSVQLSEGIRSCFLDSSDSMSLFAHVLGPLPTDDPSVWPRGPVVSAGKTDGGHGIGDNDIDGIVSRAVPGFSTLLAHPALLAAFVRHAGEEAVPCIALLADLAPYCAGEGSPVLTAETGSQIIAAHPQATLSLSARHSLRGGDARPAHSELHSFLSGQALSAFLSSAAAREAVLEGILARSAAEAAQRVARVTRRIQGMFGGDGGSMASLLRIDDGSSADVSPVRRAIDAWASTRPESRAAVDLFDGAGAALGAISSGGEDAVRTVRAFAETSRRERFDPGSPDGPSISDPRVTNAFVTLYKAAVDPRREVGDTEGIASGLRSFQTALAHAMDEASFAATRGAERLADAIRAAEKDALMKWFLSSTASLVVPKEVGPQGGKASIESDKGGKDTDHKDANGATTITSSSSSSPSRSTWSPAQVIPGPPRWVPPERILPRPSSGGWWEMCGLPIDPLGEEAELYDARRRGFAKTIAERHARGGTSTDDDTASNGDDLPWPPPRFPKLFGGPMSENAEAVARLCESAPPVYEYVLNSSLLAMKSSLARSLHARLVADCASNGSGSGDNGKGDAENGSVPIVRKVTAAPFNSDAVVDAREVCREMCIEAWGKEKWGQVVAGAGDWQNSVDAVQAMRQRQVQSQRKDVTIPTGKKDATKKGPQQQQQQKQQKQQKQQSDGGANEKDAVPPSSSSSSHSAPETGAVPEGHCAGCREPLFGPDPTADPVVTVGDRKMHRRCLVCEGRCGAFIAEAKIALYEGKVMCVPCMREASGMVCHTCRKEISPGQPSLSTVGGRRFHRDGCFLCQVCSVPCEGGYLESASGMPHCLSHPPADAVATTCGACLKTIKPGDDTVLVTSAVGPTAGQAGQYHRACVARCTTCGDPINAGTRGRENENDSESSEIGGGKGNGGQIIGGKPFCRLHAPPPACGKCDADLSDGPYISALGARFCRGCFVCTTCAGPFEGGQYIAVEGKAYCASCGPPAPQKCARPGCGKPITGKYLNVTIGDGKKVFCEGCFVCTHDECGVQFEHGFFTRDGLPVCGDHRV